MSFDGSLGVWGQPGQHSMISSLKVLKWLFNFGFVYLFYGCECFAHAYMNTTCVPGAHRAYKWMPEPPELELYADSKRSTYL